MIIINLNKIHKLKLSQNLYFQDPFPLYPGESLKECPQFGHGAPTFAGAIKPLPVVKGNQAIILTAKLDCTDAAGSHKAGDRWQIPGPLTYYPQPEVVSSSGQFNLEVSLI